MTAQKAQSLEDMIRVFRTRPLDDETWEFRCETDKARQMRGVQAIITKLGIAVKEPFFTKILFCGHRGCGKSTELNFVRRKLDDFFEIDSKSILDKYPLHAIDHRLVLYFCAERLIDMAARAKVKLTKDEKSVILEWFDKTSIEHVKKKGNNVDVKTGAGIKILQLISAGFSAKIYSGGETREESLKYVLDRVDVYNTGMKAIEQKIRKKAGKPPLIIIEDLDKIYDLNMANEIFIKNAKILGDLPFYAVFTFPIGLWYDPGSNLADAYDDREILPMIPVHLPPDDKKVSKGRDCMKEIFDKRVEKKDLIEENALDLLVRKSGGVLKDFTYMIRESAVMAITRKSPNIQMQDAKAAIRKLRVEYENFLGEFGQIKVEDIITVIDKFKKGPLSDIEQTDVFKHLLQNLCILEYNGERWYDLHPLIREYMESKRWEKV